MVSVALAAWNLASSSNPTLKVTLSGPSSRMSSMMVMVAVPPRSISSGLMVQSSVSVAPRFVGMSGVILSFTPGGSVTGFAVGCEVRVGHREGDVLPGVLVDAEASALRSGQDSTAPR